VTANDAADHSADIQACVDRARTSDRGLYIPAGTFNSFSKAISVSGTKIQGAGMWYSTIYGYNAHFDCYGNNCQYSAFSVSGDSTIRDDAATDTAFGGNGSSGVVLDGIWIEHTKTGDWPGPGTNNLTIRNSRIRDLWADGVNLWGGTTNSLVQNNHARNTGDDSFAAWSQNTTGLGPSGGNTFSHNTVQIPWRANCFGVYGGSGNNIEDNACFDVVQYPGILLAEQFGSLGFTGNTQIARNTLIRAGAWAYNQEQGAFKIDAEQAAVQSITVTGLDIVSPTYYGVHVQGPSAISAVSLSNVTISDPGEGAFYLNSGSNGSMNVDHVVATGAAQGVRDDSKGAFTLVQGAGNSGW
jgi:Right handed beta helix region